MDEKEVVSGAAENTADDGADTAVTEQIEAQREAFRKGWDAALSYRQERREAYGKEEAAPAPAEPEYVDDPITREIAEQAQRAAEHEALVANVMGGPDVSSWITSTDSVDSDELLAEHLTQLRKTVRFALSMAFDGRYGIGECLSATNAATRMIRANIALARELKASKSKTVRGGKRARRPQD